MCSPGVNIDSVHVRDDVHVHAALLRLSVGHGERRERSQDKCTSPEWVLHPSDMRHLRDHFGERRLYADAAVVHVERLRVGNATVTSLAQVQAELGGAEPVVWLSWEPESEHGSPALYLPALPPTDDQRARDFAHACPLFAASRP